jgi:hypothetical protein
MAILVLRCQTVLVESEKSKQSSCLQSFFHSVATVRRARSLCKTVQYWTATRFGTA